MSAEKPQQDNRQIVTGVVGDGPFWKYHFKNVVFGGLKPATPRVRKAGFRKTISGLDAWQIHFPDPNNSDRLTVPRSIVDECKLADLREYAIAYPSLDWAPWTLICVPLRHEAAETMFSGTPSSGTPAFFVLPGLTPTLQPPFQWDGVLINGQKKIYVFKPAECVGFPDLFIWPEKVAFGRTSASNYSLQIPERLRVSTIERPQPFARGERPAFAMSYDTIGNLILFRQPLDLFNKV